MGDNIVEPTPEAVTPPTPEPVSTESTPIIQEKPLMEPEEMTTEVEIQDEEKIEQPENIFEELDEDLSDVEESTDTIWLLRRVGIGLLKVALIVGGLIFLGWLIWGGDAPTEIQKARNELPGKIQQVKDKLPQPKNVFTKPAGEEAPVDAASAVSQSSSGRSLLLWNYWMESQRLSRQEGVLADSLIWKKEVETVFEIPFPQQINEENAILRDHQIGRLLETLAHFLTRGDVLQKRLFNDITEFSQKAAVARQISLDAEQQFLLALKNSNPEGVSELLDKKIVAEKDFQKFSVDAEARKIFAQKISQYMLVLENVQMSLTANRAAIAQNIQVVDFPSDPFGRVISPGQWGASQ